MRHVAHCDCTTETELVATVFTLMNVTSVVRIVVVCLLVTLGACGGGGSGGGEQGSATPPPPPPPPPTGVGPAGGTVSGPNGAKVVVPPGALTTNVDIKVEMTSTGAPALPTAVTAAGQTFAFTPHGTTFAVPVTVTLPFDAASVPAGFTPRLYKTNAQDQWEAVANVTVDAGTLTAQITSFSFGTAGVERLAPQRFWDFTLRSGEVLPDNDFDLPAWEEVKAFKEFPENVFSFDNDNKTTLEVFSSTDGVTFQASAEDVGRAQLIQTQGFIKRAADATLEFVITAGLLEARDLNQLPTPSECPRREDGDGNCHPIRAKIEFQSRAFDGETKPILDRNGIPALDAHAEATLEGSIGDWTFDVPRLGGFTQQAWTRANLIDTVNADGTEASFTLLDQIVLNVDLSNVGLNETFYVESGVGATALTERLRESAVRALVRDPARTGGTVMNVTGLELLDSIPSFPRAPQAPPVPCSTGPNPAAGVLEFSAPVYRSLETFLGGADVVVTRTQGSTGAVSATIATGSGSATSGVHYEPLTSRVFFADGDSEPRTMRVPLVQNAIAESDKTVEIALSEPGGCATLGAQSSAIVSILDDDTPPTLPPRFTVGGTVTGLTGTGLVLENHTSLFLEITGNGPFTFTSLPSLSGTPYFVRVFNQPRNSLGFQTQSCTVTNGSGVFANANVTNVVVTCVDL